jgi:hypothetical protein
VGPHGAGPGPPGAGACVGAGPLREGPLAETSSREDAPEGAPGKKPPGRVVVTGRRCGVATTSRGGVEDDEGYRGNSGRVGLLQ